MATKSYVANWAIHGLGDSSLEAGDRALADPESDEVVALIAAGALSESADQTVDLSTYSKAEIVEHAREQYGAELDKSDSKSVLLDQVAELEAARTPAASAAPAAPAASEEAE